MRVRKAPVQPRPLGDGGAGAGAGLGGRPTRLGGIRDGRSGQRPRRPDAEVEDSCPRRGGGPASGLPACKCGRRHRRGPGGGRCADRGDRREPGQRLPSRS